MCLLVAAVAGVFDGQKPSIGNWHEPRRGLAVQTTSTKRASSKDGLTGVPVASVIGSRLPAEATPDLQYTIYIQRSGITKVSSALYRPYIEKLNVRAHY